MADESSLGGASGRNRFSHKPSQERLSRESKKSLLSKLTNHEKKQLWYNNKKPKDKKIQLYKWTNKFSSNIGAFNQLPQTCKTVSGGSCTVNKTSRLNDSTSPYNKVMSTSMQKKKSPRVIKKEFILWKSSKLKKGWQSMNKFGMLKWIPNLWLDNISDVDTSIEPLRTRHSKGGLWSTKAKKAWTTKNKLDGGKSPRNFSLTQTDKLTEGNTSVKMNSTGPVEKVNNFNNTHQH